MLGLIPDFLYNLPVQALSTPGIPSSGLGLIMADRNFVQDPGFAGLGARTKMTGRYLGDFTCIGCPRPLAGPVGFVAVEGRPLAGVFGLSWSTLAAIGVGAGAGLYLLKRRGRRLRLPRFIRRIVRR